MNQIMMNRNHDEQVKDNDDKVDDNSDIMIIVMIK